MDAATPVDRIVHLCTQTAWSEALLAGEYRPESLTTEGFIHCSRPDQMLQVANRFYQGSPALVLLWIDPHQIHLDIRWEQVENQVFPHLYSPLKTEAVLAVRPFVPDLDGVFRQEPGL
jgi:uncharacterized protein (DUF952 family)